MRSYASAASNATQPTLFEPMILSILLAQQKKIMRLEKALDAQPSKLRKLEDGCLMFTLLTLAKLLLGNHEKRERIKQTDNFQQCIYVSGEQTALEGLIDRLCRNQKIASWNFVQKYVSQR
jgi:hypothetical protein